MDKIGLLLGTLLVVFLVALGAIYLHDRHYDGQSWKCQTRDAQMINSTTDNNLHVTLWCVKDGKIVP